jgi:hypothetical protein
MKSYFSILSESWWYAGWIVVKKALTGTYCIMLVCCCFYGILSVVLVAVVYLPARSKLVTLSLSKVIDLESVYCQTLFSLDSLVFLTESGCELQRMLILRNIAA